MARSLFAAALALLLIAGGGTALAAKLPKGAVELPPSKVKKVDGVT
jgi:hypothetical protein